MLLIGLKNFGTQTVLADGVVNVGSVYRRFCKKNRCGVPAFGTTANGVSLNHEGIYHITATFVGTASAAGVATIQLALNGILVDGALASETFTTADTEVRTFVIDYYAKVDNNCVLGVNSTDVQTVTFVNTSDTIDVTLTSVVINVDKVV